MKRISLLLVVLVLLALVAGSVSAAPAPAKGGGGEWNHVCLDGDNLNVFVRSDNVLQYECTGASLYGWTEICDKKAMMGFTTSGKTAAIYVQCGF